jgi:hypothetical protein
MTPLDGTSLAVPPVGIVMVKRYKTRLFLGLIPVSWSGNYVENPKVASTETPKVIW